MFVVEEKELDAKLEEEVQVTVRLSLRHQGFLLKF